MSTTQRYTLHLTEKEIDYICNHLSTQSAVPEGLYTKVYELKERINEDRLIDRSNPDRLEFINSVERLGY